MTTAKIRNIQSYAMIGFLLKKLGLLKGYFQVEIELVWGAYYIGNLFLIFYIKQIVNVMD